MSQLGACVAGNSTPSTVYVINTPEPDGVTTSQSICYNTNTTLAAGCAIGLVKWYQSNGSTLLYTGSPFVTPNLPSSTTYKVRCEVNGSLNCKSIFIDVPVNVNPIISPPTNAAASSNSICAGTSVTLTATCAVGTVKWYNSPTSTTAIGTGSPLIVSPNVTTSYYPTCFSNNCEGARINGAGEIVSTLTVNDPVFDRSGGSFNYYHYKTHSFSLNNSSLVTISLSTLDGGYVIPTYSDTYLYLYGPGGFNPASPLSNRIAADDDSGGGGSSRILTNLAAGNYTVVMTSYSSSANLPWTYKLVLLGLPPLSTSVTVTPNTVTIPTAAGQTVIAGNAASLVASCTVGNPNWYTFNESTLLFEGSPFVTPTVTENTIYKVRCKNIVCNSAFVEVAITATNLVYSIKTGNWEDPTTWNTGVVPTSNDNVIIDLTHIVTINNDQARAKHVEFRTDAHLNFANEQAKLNLGL